MMCRSITTFLSALLICVAVLAQNTRTVTDSFTYTYYSSDESMNISRAKVIAVERAKTGMIEKHFGTSVGQTSSSILSNSSGKESNLFYTFGETEVNGEWIRTIGEPRFDPIRIENNLLVVTVHIKGEIREIKSSGVQLRIQTLRCGVGEANESDVFVDGDDFFMSVESPISGHIAVYIFPDGEKVQRLLPYDDSEGSFSLKGDERNVLFKENGNSRYVMVCNGDEQFNKVYVIFSPTPFVHPNDDVNSEKVGQSSFPNELDFEDFQKWLSRARRQDHNMVVASKIILVKKK